VIAEGVETREQLAFLTAQGCDLAQGFYFARPMDHAAFSAYLAEVRAGLQTLLLSAGDGRLRRIGNAR
jgi:sensor c-di-GMP phosphodiesterase-like protein